MAGRPLALMVLPLNIGENTVLSLVLSLNEKGNKNLVLPVISLISHQAFDLAIPPILRHKPNSTVLTRPPLKCGTDTWRYYSSVGYRYQNMFLKPRDSSLVLDYTIKINKFSE